MAITLFLCYRETERDRERNKALYIYETNLNLFFGHLITNKVLININMLLYEHERLDYRTNK